MAGCSATSVSAYENCAAPPQGGFPYPGLTSPAIPDTLYRIVAQRNQPTGTNSTFLNACEAMLRSRSLPYWKNSPGDCGSPSALGGVSSGQIVGLSGSAASGVVGGLGAAGVLAGPATFGISTAVALAVAGIQDIFAHHAQAVANEQATLCSVSNYFNPLLRKIDTAVQQGQITPDQAILYVKQVGNQAINGLQGIYKPCNASCWYIGYLKAHVDFVASLYPALSPYGPSGLSAQAPGSAPTTYGNPPGSVPDSGASAPLRSAPLPIVVYSPAGPPAVTAPAAKAPNLVQNTYLPAGSPSSVLPSGNVAVINHPASVALSPSDYLNIGYNQPTGQSGQAADVPASPISLTTILIAALVIILLLAVL